MRYAEAREAIDPGKKNCFLPTFLITPGKIEK
jgi:hypothetical protein